MSLTHLSHSLNSRSCKLVVSPSMVEDLGGPASSRAPSLGLLVTSARRLAKQLAVSKYVQNKFSNHLRGAP